MSKGQYPESFFKDFTKFITKDKLFDKTLKEQLRTQEQSMLIIHSHEEALLVDIVSSSVTPVEIAIYSRLLCILSLHYEYSLNSSLLTRETKIFKYLCINNIEINRPLVKSLEALCYFLPIENTWLPVFSDELDLESRFNQFKADPIDIKGKLHQLLPELKDADLDPIVTYIKKIREKITHYFEMFLNHNKIVKSYCTSRKEDFEKLQKQHFLLYIKKLEQSGLESKDLLSSQLIRSKVILINKMLIENDFKLDMSVLPDNPLKVVQDFIFPTLFPEMVNLNILRHQLFDLSTQLFKDTKKTARLMPAEQKTDEEDFWDLAVFKKKLKKMTLKETSLLDILWKACKQDARKSHIQFLFNKILTPIKINQLINQAHEKYKSTPIQCAIKCGSCGIIKYLFNYPNITFTPKNLQIALSYTEDLEITRLIQDKLGSIKEFHTEPKISITEKKLIAAVPLKSLADEDNIELALKQLREQKSQIAKLITQFKLQIEIQANHLQELESFTQLAKGFNEEEENFAKIEKKVAELVKPVTLLAIQQIQTELARQLKYLEDIPVRLQRIEREAKSLEPPPSIIKKPQLKTKKIKRDTSSKKKKTKKKPLLTITTPPEVCTSPIKITEIKSEIKTSITTLSEEPKSLQLLSPTSTPILFWRDHKRARQTKILQFCDYVPQTVPETHLQHNALLFEIMRYMEIQKHSNLPIGYPDAISQQLGSKNVFSVRNAIVHSFSFLNISHDTTLTQDLKETIAFARALVDAMKKRDFNELKTYTFYIKAQARGLELEKKDDIIPELMQKIEHILYIGTQQLQIAEIAVDNLPIGMKKSALDMLQIRMQKYFHAISLNKTASAPTNTLTHLGERSGSVSPTTAKRIISEQLTTTWAPYA